MNTVFLIYLLTKEVKQFLYFQIKFNNSQNLFGVKYYI